MKEDTLNIPMLIYWIIFLGTWVSIMVYLLVTKPAEDEKEY